VIWLGFCGNPIKKLQPVTLTKEGSAKIIAKADAPCTSIRFKPSPDQKITSTPYYLFGLVNDVDSFN